MGDNKGNKKSRWGRSRIVRVGIRVEISGFRGRVRVRVGIEVEERRGRVEMK